MRPLVLVGLLGAAACSGDTGLVLTISAPEALAGATRLEIVLASPEAIATADGQQTGGMVRYYRQKSVTAPIDLQLVQSARDDRQGLDGLVVRIEGRDGQGDEPFVPLVFAYGGGADAGSPQPIAAGAVLDERGLPVALVVPSGARHEATAALLPLQVADPAIGVLSGQIEELRCGSNTGPWRSGIAWQPPAALQLRLLFPDPAAATGLDATARPLDLDCDGAIADGGDCDDLRAAYRPGAAEVCDGLDTNCDGSHFALTPCSLASTSCNTGGGTGIQLCQDIDPSTTLGLCAPTPACLCEAGACARCTLAFEGSGGETKPCAPGLAKLPAGTCDAISPCHVEVVQTDLRWDAAVAIGAQAELKQSVDLVTGELWLRVKPGPAAPPPRPGASVGTATLVITRKGAEPLYLGFDLQIAASVRSDGCSGLAISGGNYGMTCTLP